MVTLAGRNVLRAEVTENRSAAWTAIVEIDSDVAITGLVALDIDGETFTGTVMQADVEEGRCKALLVGGRGGLLKVLGANYYYQSRVGDVLADIARESGEVLDPAIGSTLLGQTLPRWSRLQGDAHTAVRQLADHLEVEWRITRQGTLWIGPETWPAVSVSFLPQVYSPELRLMSIAITGEPERPVVRPGVTFDGRHVERVTTALIERELRQDVYFDETKGQAGWMAAVMRRIREVVMPKLALSRFYVGRVVGQSADGGLTLVMDDALVAGKWKGIDHLPVLFGLPGITATIANGARVRLCWDGGDPSQPRAALFDQGAEVDVLALTVGATLKLGGETAAAPVARVGDAVGQGVTMAAWMAQVTAALNGLSPGSITAAPIDFGTIATGSSKVKSV